MRLAADLLHAPDLVVHLGVVPGEEGTAVDDHVDLVRPELGDARGLLDLQLRRNLPRGERGRRGHLDAAPRARARARAARGWGRRTRPPPGAPSGRRGPGRIAFEQSAAILPGVSAPSSVVRSIIRTARSSAKSFDSRLIERVASRGALLDGDLVDRADPRKPRLERQLETARQCGCLSHGRSVAPRLLVVAPSPRRRRQVIAEPHVRAGSCRWRKHEAHDEHEGRLVGLAASLAGFAVASVAYFGPSR